MYLVDHLFVLVLFVVQPVYGYFSYKRYLQRIADGETADRTRLYRQIIVMEWLALAGLATTWVWLDRPAAALGLVTPAGTGFWAGSAVLAAVTAYLLYARNAAGKLTAAEKADQVKSLGSLEVFLPHDDRDYRYFVATSITAGIVEELVYRAFCFWYLAHFMPIWAVVVLSSVIFGLGHSYQGAGGIVRVTLIGVAFGVFYVFAGSIWLPILAHAILDILQGATILECLRRDESVPAPAAADS